jgi:TolA-binding protein
MRQPLIVPVTLCLLLALSLLVPCTPQASEKKAEGKSEGKAAAPQVVEKPPPLAPLWAKAQEFLQLGDIRGASRLLYLVHSYYPEDAKGEPALWQAANLQKELALTAARNPDWDTVLNHFRRYVDYYPKSPRAAEAYFELGKTYQAMRFHREAQAYFKLFMERYPESPLVPQAMRSYRNSILRAGRGDEATKVFQGWAKSADPTIRQMGEAGEAILKSIQGDDQGAQAIFQKILDAAPDYPVTDPEILRYAGATNLRLDKVEEGREALFHYLTLTGLGTADRAEVMVELAESYFKAKEYEAAQKLYRQVTSEGGGNERVVLLSNFRQTQMLDDPEITLAKWERHNDLTDQEGDKPYLAVLEKLYRDPVAQEARFGMFKRFQAREQLDQAYEMGRNFLRSSEPTEATTAQGKRAGQILLYLVEDLLRNKRYQDIYDLYSAEYRHIKDFPSAKLHIMVGQALETLALYEPAAALYYLALQWPMTDQEKTDLYFRRARAYLALKDYGAMERLLTYLNTTYHGQPEAGEIALYGAKLSAARGEIDKAHDLYLQAIKQPTFPDKRPTMVEEALELLVGQGRRDQAQAILTLAVTEKWLSPERQQGWWLRIGNGWREANDLVKARAAYEKGLGQGLPDKGDGVQEIHLYLGDVMMAAGDQAEGLKHYQAAGQGGNPLWQRLANERLTQQSLDAEMADMKKRAAR